MWGAGSKEWECLPFDPVNRRSSVQSTHKTAFPCPSATWTHCSVAERLLLVDGTGLITPLRKTKNKHGQKAKTWTDFRLIL